MVIGTPDSWGPTKSFSGKGVYLSSTWSPCGRFIAAQTEKDVEIRSHLTFELITILRPTVTPKPQDKGLLAYSPNGRSLACDFWNSIVIWDTQTGGVVEEIEIKGRTGPVSLAWSLDGQTIATTTLDRKYLAQSVKAYEVASGVRLFTKRIQLSTDQPFPLWGCETSFRFMTKTYFPGDPTLKISIFEIGPTLTKVESFVVMMDAGVIYFPAAFSPPTYRISIMGQSTLRVLDVRNSDCLLKERGDFNSSEFTPDGGHIAAYTKYGLHVWKYASGGYIPWGRYPRPGDGLVANSLQIFPIPSSILFSGGNVLQVRRLENSPAAPKTHRQFAGLSHSGHHIATSHELESTVTIIDLRSQSPSQFIETGVDIRGLAITGNVLLVAGSETIVAWLLTEEGMVDGVLEGRRAGRRNSLWTTPSTSRPCTDWSFKVEGQVGVIRMDLFSVFAYHTGTGEVIQPAQRPRHPGRSQRFSYRGPNGREYYGLRYQSLPNINPPKDGWVIPGVTVQGAGWVMDHEGRHRIWVPSEWREWYWHHDIGVLFGNVGDLPIIIKF